MPFTGSADDWARVSALIERRDELGGDDSAAAQAIREHEPEYIMEPEHFLADLRLAGCLA
jgi:hypothetical protein